ncbi:IS21-like element helper ATPase IstB [Candidatus Neptunochlamydia vexilliferae]|uniref:Insertion sequence ATP-binding protein y4iQ/y4nD/y4sD n=1 Tax=Candidatus Neptunichlamydia vexilliferae TaxID=1651774 RepID=A0ABS0AXC1_9BACT|nr:IS21-like element helper ATPase IstB [Candidatus Neptunochlamydia vexilliferae]MBF5058787.1 putative insertion sequence ATP-binding protein y4iQ/y4nD/y4sD [Candidatus Neptunochlamydia vexilliferae]
MKKATLLPTLLKQLRLPTVKKLWEEESIKAIEEGWHPSYYLQVLCEYELSHRDNRRLKRHMAEAKLPKGKTLETFDFETVPKLNKTQINAFGSGEIWIENGRNLLMFGPSGTGKTHLAAAIGEKLIISGYRVLFNRTTELVQKLQEAKKNLTLPSALEKLSKYDCLILDDFGYAPKNQEETNVLFELICERYETKSLLITSNQSFVEWDKIFMDKAMAVAAADRLVHHATIIEVEAESYRRQAALKQLEQNKKEKALNQQE